MNVQKARLEEFKQILVLLKACANEMNERGIHQWDETYPNNELVLQDIENGSMRSVYLDHELAAVLVMDEIQSKQYQNVRWKYQSPPILVVHRLATHPSFQKRGLGKKLMEYAQESAEKLGYKSIRLDAYKLNKPLQDFYLKLGYEKVGEIPLEYTAGPFVCFEKKIS